MKIPSKLFLLSAVLCFLNNLFNASPIQAKLINTLLFLGYARLYYDTSRSSSGGKMLPFLAFMPLFAFNYHQSFIYLVEIFIFLIFYLVFKINNRFFRFGLLVALTLACLYSSFASFHIVSWPVDVDWEKLLYPQHLFQLEVERQQKESLYLPYSLRFVVFNDFTAYSYLFLSNLFTFLSLENFYRALLLVNVFYLAIGLIKIRKMKSSIRTPIVFCLLISLLTVGLIKTPDTLTSFSISRGSLLLIVLYGIDSAKKTRWLYFPGWFLSILLMLGLRI